MGGLFSKGEVKFKILSELNGLKEAAVKYLESSGRIKPGESVSDSQILDFVVQNLHEPRIQTRLKKMFGADFDVDECITLVTQKRTQLIQAALADQTEGVLSVFGDQLWLSNLARLVNMSITEDYLKFLPILKYGLLGILGNQTPPVSPGPSVRGSSSLEIQPECIASPEVDGVARVMEAALMIAQDEAYRDAIAKALKQFEGAPPPVQAIVNIVGFVSKPSVGLVRLAASGMRLGWSCTKPILAPVLSGAVEKGCGFVQSKLKRIVGLSPSHIEQPQSSTEEVAKLVANAIANKEKAIALTIKQTIIVSFFVCGAVSLIVVVKTVHVSITPVINKNNVLVNQVMLQVNFFFFLSLKFVVPRIGFISARIVALFLVFLYYVNIWFVLYFLIRLLFIGSLQLLGINKEIITAVLNSSQIGGLK